MAPVGIEIRGGENGRPDEMGIGYLFPFSPKTYPIDLGSTIDISPLAGGRNGESCRDDGLLDAPVPLCQARVNHSFVSGFGREARVEQVGTSDREQPARLPVRDRYEG